MTISLNSIHVVPPHNFKTPAGIRNGGVINKSPQELRGASDRVSINRTQLHGNTGQTDNIDPAGDAFSFLDIIDIINPLQHIPIVSTIYRAVTNDAIKAPARILGGGIFGGVIGGILGIVNAVLTEATGRDIGGHLMALFQIGDKHPPSAPEARVQNNGGTETTGITGQLTYAPARGALPQMVVTNAFANTEAIFSHHQ